MPQSGLPGEQQMVDFAGSGAPMIREELAATAQSLGVALPELWSVISVETSGMGFLSDRRPKILFERHIFSRLTGGQYDADDPDISQPSQGGYGPGGAHQYDRLAAAMLLDEEAALKSASWGLGQIMGENFSAAGFGKVQDMVRAMVQSEANQLQAMASFINKSGMTQFLRAHDWAGFARRYNGPNYVANNYDGHLRQFYQIYSSGSLPDLQIRAAQIYLTYKNLSPGPIDGVAGSRTTAAVKQFQSVAGLPVDGMINDALLKALST
jgi:hypothetical protein